MLKEEAYIASTVISNCRVARGRDALVGPDPLDVVIEDGRIVRIVAAGEGHGEETINGARCLLVPGMINGHFHSHEHFQKGHFDNLTLELWMNFVRPPKPPTLTSRQVYLRTLIGAIEAIRSGTTTVVDDVNIGAALDREHLAAIHQAHEEIGIRALVGVSMMDRPFFEALPFVDEEFEPDLLDELRQAHVASAERLLALAEELALTRHPKANRVGFIVSPSAPQRCTDGFLKALRALADRYDLPVMIHAQETRLQVVTGLLASGKTHIERLDEIGFLKPATAIVHGVWLTPNEIGLLARSGATVQHNPWSNLRLGSGVAPVRALLDAGVNVSVATDGCSSTDTCNLLNSVGLAAALHTLRGTHAEWVHAREAFQAATAGGAKALGRTQELGVIEEGAIADLVLYRLDSAPFVPQGDLIQQLVYAERGASMETSLVEGRPVFLHGRFVGIDEAAILAERRGSPAGGRHQSLPCQTQRLRSRCDLGRLRRKHLRCLGRSDFADFVYIRPIASHRHVGCARRAGVALGRRRRNIVCHRDSRGVPSRRILASARFRHCVDRPDAVAADRSYPGSVQGGRSVQSGTVRRAVSHDGSATC
jgi:5-methylthioadenosine/S-adenosylhomocysteine deaminase